MRLKTNLIISVLFVVLAGFVYLYEIRGGEERRVAAEREKKLVDVQDHEVGRVEIDRADTVLVLERDEDGWRLTSPVTTGVDDAAVDRYLRALREAEVEGDPVQDSSAVASDPTLLADYGLDAPRLRVAVRKVDGTALDTLRFGDDTPTDRYTYVQRSGANPEVVRVRAWRFDNLDKGLHDLRDRRLLAFEQAQVRRLRLHRAGADVELVRVGGDWRLEQPVARAADADAVRRILSGLSNARTTRVVHERPADAELEGLGLAPGAESLGITLWLGEDLAEKRLRLGAAIGDEAGGVYGRDSSRPQVMVVDSTVVNRVRTPLADLRDRRLLRVTADSVVAIELTRDGDVVFDARRDSTGAWSLATPADRPAKTWRLNSLLTDVDALEAKAFVRDGADLEALGLPAFGLGTPAARLTLTLGDGEVRRLWVGDRDGTEAHVLNPDVASIAVVDDDDVENLLPLLDDVASPPATPDSAAAAAGE